MSNFWPGGDTLILDTIAFDQWSTPSKVEFGMDHMLGVQKLIGGDRIIDAMGQDPATIKWEGRWRTAIAASNNDACIALSQSGAQVSCTWGEYFFTVVVSKYASTYEDYFEIPYTIELTVVPDSSSNGSPPTSLDSLVGSDMTTATAATGSFQ